MIFITGSMITAQSDINSIGLTFTLVGIVATLTGTAVTYFIIKLRENRRAKEDFKNSVAIIYHEIKDNMITLNAGAQIGLMKVNTSGLDLLKARNIYMQLPEDVLRDVLSIYWYFNFINDVVNLELTLFMVSSLTTVDSGKIFEINDRQAKETHKRCLKEIQKTRIISRLEEML
ncbi:MAG TPA: hypothetical protein VN455_03780 [Methanotrichaceae archaeon]|nr:hypothetical protein [Methanotrichaceae archaeon]